MSDIVIPDPTLVLLLNKPQSSADSNNFAVESVIAGEAIALDKTSDPNKWTKASSGNDVKAGVGGIGIALNAASLDQPVSAAKDGSEIDFGSPILVPGNFYYVSPNVGRISDSIADLTTGMYVTQLGYATTTQIMKVAYKVTGVVRA